MTQQLRNPQAAQSAAAKVIGAMLLLGFGVFVLPTMVVLAVGMMPTMAAYVTDRRREKYAAFCVGAANLCGVLPFALALWTVDHSFDHALKQIGDPLSWFVMYGAAAFGWAIYYVTPGIIALFLQVQIQSRIDKLKQYQADLIEEWGQGIAKSKDAAEE
ncbi:MAG: hypothetical protein HYR63_26020 [Proteobacteria bacterium]|nr:hypothetical protein [Pseudomonadota bacterium]